MGRIDDLDLKILSELANRCKYFCTKTFKKD